MCLEGEYANSKLHEALTETEATLHKVEAELARVTYALELEREQHGVTRQAKSIAAEAMARQMRQRNAYKRVVNAFLEDRTAAEFAENLRYWIHMGSINEVAYAAQADALEALPSEVTQSAESVAKSGERWDATLRAVEAQRDALKAELAEVSADRDSWEHCARNS